MSICPNVNLPEWKTLEEEVGKFEAYRDFMETEGLIRTPAEVKKKLSERKNKLNPSAAYMSKSPSLVEVASFFNQDHDYMRIDQSQLKNGRAVELADKMSNALGVEYAGITEEEAKEVTKNSPNPWAGEAAFFYKGKVYFIASRMSSDMVLHEFSHPLVRAIAKENPELFNELYAAITKTEEGVSIINTVTEKYKELDPDSRLFREEVIVKALEKAASLNIDGFKTTTAFAKAIKDLLVFLKGLMRKVFGKSIKISKLNPNTSLDELASILNSGDKIDINTEVISEEDIVAYNKESQAFVNNDLQSVRNEDIQQSINSFYDTIVDHLNKLTTDNNYEELARLLTDENNRGELNEMKSNLSKWQSSLRNTAEKMGNDAETTRKRAHALSSTLFQLENVMTKIYEHTASIARNNQDPREGMHKAHYYESIVKHWGKVINELNKSMIVNVQNNVAPNSELEKLVSGISRNIERTQSIIDTLKADGARDALYDQLSGLNKNVSSRYEAIIKDLKDKGAPQDRIDKVFKEYHGLSEFEWNKFKALSKADKEGNLGVMQQKELAELSKATQQGLSISKDKIEQLLKGNIGDSNWFNSYLEGYLYNTDPIVGGLALYIKNATNEVMTKVQAKYNNFSVDLREDLIKAGYNPNNIASLGKSVSFEDTIGITNPETGVVEQKKIWTLLNNYKNYRYEKEKHRVAVENANRIYSMSNNDTDKQLFLDAVAAQKKMLRTYFNQEFNDEYYKREELFEDDLGKEASFRRGEILERISMINNTNKTQSDQLDASPEIDAAWRDYAQLYSMYDLNGNLKQGLEADIAKRLRKHREESRKFHEFKIRKGAFENAYHAFKQELRAEGLSDDSNEFKDRVDLWKKKNSRITIKPEYYEKRSKVLDRIKEIMSNLPQNERAKLDQSAIWEKMLDLMSNFRDDDGQPNATEMSAQSLETIAELQEDLERIRETSVLRSGLTREESVELSNLYEILTTNKVTGEKFTDFERVRFDALNQKRKDVGLDKNQTDDLNALYAALSAMSNTEATTYYVDIANNWLSKLDTTKLEERYGLKEVDGTTAQYLSDPIIADDLMAQSPEFKQWFKANHIVKEKYNAEAKDIQEVYERINAWSVTRPSDPNMYESYKIKDALGNVEDVVYGVPNMKYYTQRVKDEFRTRKQIGINVDNQGAWLPKSRKQMEKIDTPDKFKFINEEYEKLQVEKPEMAQVLAKLKKHHLANQEGLSYNSRLYLDVPRYGKSNLEEIQSFTAAKAKDRINALTYYAKRFKDFFTGGGDQGTNGLNYDEKLNLVKADMFDDTITGIPISGLVNMDSEEVSLDITHSMMRYMLSAERQKQLVKISPVVRSIQSTVNHEDNAIKDLNRVNKREYENRGVLQFFNKKNGGNVRRSAINNLVEREFEGVTQKGLGSDQAWLNNFANVLFKRASFSFFALNLPSALKNSLGMKFQSMIEASGGQYVDHISLQKGNLWAYKAMGELSFGGQLYNQGPKSHMQQLVDIFDPIQGRFEDKFAEGMSRTFAKDVASVEWLYSPRKWVETQAGIQLFGGMMYKKKINRTMPDGTVQEIPYIDAWETVDGQIKLKSGIDAIYAQEPVNYVIKQGDTIASIAKANNTTEETIENAMGGKSIQEYLDRVENIEFDRADALSDLNIDGAVNEQARLVMMDRADAINKKYDALLEKNTVLKIDNSEFKFVKNQIHQVQNNMGGAYSKFDQPEAQRYIAFRFISYLRRYFTTMATNRWGFSGKLLDPKPRLNPGLGDVQMGFYIQFMKTLIDTMRSGGNNLQYLTPQEKVAFLKFTAEVGMLVMTSMLMGLLFGWDPEDDERYAKLRAKSGALPFPFVDGDDSRPFDLLGYTEVHALHMLMQVRAENEQFNLLTGGIHQYNSLLDIKSVALGPTTDSYVQLWDDFKKIVTGDPGAYYTRDTGPYDWQQQGGSKFINHFVKTFGLTGTTLDGALAIQNFQSYQAKVR